MENNTLSSRRELMTVEYWPIGSYLLINSVPDGLPVFGFELVTGDFSVVPGGLFCLRA